jgi:Ca2+-binding RTX toxin-like protein
MAFASLESPDGFTVFEGQTLDFQIVFNDATFVSASYTYSFSTVGGTADTSDFVGTGNSEAIFFSINPPEDVTIESFSMAAVLDDLDEGQESLFLNVSFNGIAFEDSSTSKSFEIFIRDVAENVPPQGTVTIEGEAFAGNTLTVDPSGLSDADGIGEFSYQWLRNGIPIVGAVDVSYVVVPEDIGTSLTVRVSYTDLLGTDESVVSNAAQVVLEPGTDGNDLIFGTPLDDTLSGGAGDDTLFGIDGNDVLAGGIDNDSIEGGNGNDSISGSDGNDVINGGLGADNIGGGLGTDTIDGGDGDDIIGGGFGADSISGGAGNDVVAGGADNDTLDGGDGNDSMSGSFGNDLISGGDGDDAIGGGTGQDTIDAGAGNDSVGGGEGDDSILGGDGNDFLAGGGRDDVIDGGADNDTINAGAGNDVITGGTEADQFVFSSFFDGEADVITDFEDGIDSFLIRRVDPDTGETNITNGGNGLAGFVAAMNIVDVEGGAQMSVNGNTILVEGITAAQLTLDDFTFL